jgi:arylsulfatase A-like enzyme
MAPSCVHRRAILGLLLSFSAFVPLAPAQPGPPQPDVIVLLTDQQRADAFGAAGARDLHTPTMDRLAREGVLFSRAFAATPQCSPSRAALITGRYPHRTGVMGNTIDSGQRIDPPAGMSAELDRSLPTFARVFAAAGYDTAYFGKWHLGGTPGDYGFEVHDARVDDETLARRVTTFLQERGGSNTPRPLLLFVSWLNPHEIYGVLTKTPSARALAEARLPSNLVDDLKDKPFPQRHFLEQDQGRPFVGAGADVWRRYRAFYNELVETVDAEMGAVLAALPRRDVPPITIFSADHGDHGGSHGLPYKGPAMYEEVVRIPFVVSWRSRISPARSDALVTHMDVLPTVCDLTGVRPPDRIDGLSVRPILEQRTPSVRTSLVVEYYGKQAWRVPIRMLRTPRWKYVRYLGYGEELYDLSTDPGEVRNLAGDAAAASERSRLAGELDAWIQRTADPFPTLTVTDRAGKPIANPTSVR